MAIALALLSFRLGVESPIILPYWLRTQVWTGFDSDGVEEAGGIV